MENPNASNSGAPVADTSPVPTLRDIMTAAVCDQGREEGWQLDEETGEERLPFYGDDINSAGTITIRESLGPCVMVQVMLSPERAIEVIEYVKTGKGFVRSLAPEIEASETEASVPQVDNAITQ